jgi:hypothetical protein
MNHGAIALRLRLEQHDRLPQFLIIGEPAAHFLDRLTAHADLTRASARIGHRQHEDLVAVATRAFPASCAVPDRVLQQRAAQQLAGDRHFADQLVARADGLPSQLQIERNRPLRHDIT